MKKAGLGMLLALLAVLLAVTVWLGERQGGGVPLQEGADSPEQALLDAVFDRAGVTRWAEALAWYEMETSGMFAEAATPDTPVWVPRHGQRRFHSIPLCDGMKGPTQSTLMEALGAGLSPCPVCWTQR